MRQLAIFAIAVMGCRGQEATPVATAQPSGAPAATPPVATATDSPNPARLASAPPATPPAAESPAATSGSGARAWSFDGDKAGSPPSGFSFGRTGSGRAGSWVVRAESGAPSAPNVLAQADADSTDYRFPVAFASDPSVRDLELKVRCKPISGAVDQACGLVFRLKDADNYYLTRANALENNVRLYYVKGGNRQQVATWSGKVSSGSWHDYRVIAQGDHFEVYWDGAKVIDNHDKTFTDAGKVGLWTKADSVTYFDDLSVTPK